MKKRLLSMILALALCLSLLPAVALAVEGDDYIASVSIDGTTNYYNAIADAFSAASGKTAVITLLAKTVRVRDAALLVNDANSDITLELNGNTLQYLENTNLSEGGIIVVSAGKLTIQDSCDAPGRIYKNIGDGISLTGGSLTVKSGTVEASSFAIRATDGVTVTVDGGTVTGGTGIYASGSSYIHVNGGLISSSANGINTGAGAVNITISGGVISAGTNGIRVSFGGKVLTITGGFISGSSNNMYTEGVNTVSISGGWFKHQVDQAHCAQGYVPTTQAQTVDGSPDADAVWYTVMQPTPPSITVTGTADSPTQVTLIATVDPSDAGGTVTYAMNTTDTTPLDGWQESPVFTGLSENTTYYFFAKVAADGAYLEAISDSCAITTPAKAVSSIAVETQPSMLDYTTGDTLDLTGLSVKVNYNDGSTEIITDFSKLTTDPANGTSVTVSAHNDKGVTITYGGQTCETEALQVSKGTQAALHISGVPGTVYAGDSFTLTASGGSGTGEVQWSVISGPAEIDQAGNVNITGTGEIVIQAVKAADADYIQSDVTVTFTAVRKPSLPSVRPTYPPEVDDTNNGSVSVTPARPSRGDKVTITPKPDAGYEVETVTVTDQNGDRVKVSKNADGTYSFIQPAGKVTVSVQFACNGGRYCPSRAFSDLDTSQWYHKATDFVIESGLMNGSGGKFYPDEVLTRAELAQILYNRAGQPELTQMSTFTDVPATAWYAKAVAWAQQNKVVDGVGGNKFAPDRPITREQIAVMLYNDAGRPAVSGTMRGFADADGVSGWAADAMLWATRNEIIGGVLHADGTRYLKATDGATRAEAAAMLQRYFGQK